MEEKRITAYKGFDENLCCRGFQYEVGKEYKQEGEIKCCENGFHACVNPFDVLFYYDVDDKNRFCEVEQSGTISVSNDASDTKQSSSRIRIKAEIGWVDLFKAGIKWMEEKTNPMLIAKEMERLGYSNQDFGNYFSINDCDKINSENNLDRIGSCARYAEIHSSGCDTEIGSIGHCAVIHSSGNSVRIGSSGFDTKIHSDGNYAQITSSGNCDAIGSTGHRAAIGSSGWDVKIHSSGDNARIGSTGGDNKISSSGYSAKIGSSGNSARISSSGNSARVYSTGEDSVICCAGDDSIAKASLGSWITLSEWRYSDEKHRKVPVCVKTEYVDGERIKADTWYKLVDGEFKESF